MDIDIDDKVEEKKYLGCLKSAYFVEKRKYLSFHDITACLHPDGTLILKDQCLKNQVEQTFLNIELALRIKKIPVTKIFEIHLMFKEAPSVEVVNLIDSSFFGLSVKTKVVDNFPFEKGLLFKVFLKARKN